MNSLCRLSAPPQISPATPSPSFGNLTISLNYRYNSNQLPKLLSRSFSRCCRTISSSTSAMYATPTGTKLSSTTTAACDQVQRAQPPVGQTESLRPEPTESTILPLPLTHLPPLPPSCPASLLHTLTPLAAMAARAWPSGKECRTYRSVVTLMAASTEGGGGVFFREGGKVERTVHTSDPHPAQPFCFPPPSASLSTHLHPWARPAPPWPPHQTRAPPPRTWPSPSGTSPLAAAPATC